MYSPVSMTENESLPLAIRVYRNEYGCHNQENRKTGNQANRFAVAIIMITTKQLFAI